MSTIGIVIPVYNHEDVLRGTLEAIFSGTRKPDQVIVIDDGSEKPLSEDLNQAYPEVKFVRQDNQGSNAARNNGLKLLDTDYVMCLDADARLEEGALEALKNALDDNPEKSFSYGSFYFGPKFFRVRPYSFEALKKNSYIHTSALVRRHDHPGFDESIKRFQDWDLWLTMGEQGKFGVFVDMLTMRVVIDGDSRIGSYWLPSFVYKLPWSILPKPKRIKDYINARDIIVKKHNL